MAELRIMITVPLPDGLFERAQTIARLKGPLDTLGEEISADMDLHYKVEHEIIDTRTPTPHKSRSDAGRARTPRVAQAPVREAAE